MFWPDLLGHPHGVQPIC